MGMVAALLSRHIRSGSARDLTLTLAIGSWAACSYSGEPFPRRPLWQPGHPRAPWESGDATIALQN